MLPRKHLIAAVSSLVVISGMSPQATETPTLSGHFSHGGQSATPAPDAMHVHGGSVPAVTLAELEETVQQLSAARSATEKYKDVRLAERDGYRAIGPDVPGMGIHYVRKDRQRTFSVTEPPILLYERDADTPVTLHLVGVSYLYVAPSDPEGQPLNPPFPKALATWHKHNNICVLPDNSASADLSESQCKARGGQFTAETSWMVHAWIWKDSPTGVFSPTNPLVR